MFISSVESLKGNNLLKCVVLFFFCCFFFNFIVQSGFRAAAVEALMSHIKLQNSEK